MKKSRLMSDAFSRNMETTLYGKYKNKTKTEFFPYDGQRRVIDVKEQLEKEFNAAISTDIEYETIQNGKSGVMVRFVIIPYE